MNQEAWPTPPEQSPTQAPARDPLPRVEDLPVAEQGYEQESVKAAFDSFYRHAAQLDAALRTLEAVDSFHRQAAALRADLRSLRTAGWTQQSWNVTPAYGYGTRAPREGISPAVWRFAGEVAFIIAASVAVGVAKLDWWLILLVLGVVIVLIGLIEWAAARERSAVPRAAAPPPPVVEGEAVVEPRSEEPESRGWTAFKEAQEPSDAMTMIGSSPVPEEVVEAEPEANEPEPEPASEIEPEPAPAPEPGLEAAEPVPAAEPKPEAVVEPEPDAEAEAEAPEQRRRWWRRSSHDGDVHGEHDLEPEQPRHVRVLSTEDAASSDPWEHGFDEGAHTDEGEPLEEQDGEAALASEADESVPRSRRR